MLKPLPFLLCALPLWLLVGCGFSPRSYSPECRDFHSQTRERRHAEFRSYPVEKQLDLYLCAMSIHNPDLFYAASIADLGPEVIPAVVARMKKAGDSDKAELLYIMELMSDRGHLRRRVDVYAELSQMVDGINPVTRQRCEERLKKIAINSGIKQFTYTSFDGAPRPARRI